MSTNLPIGSEIPIQDCHQFPEYCWEDTNGNYLGNYTTSGFEERNSSTEHVRRIECPDICPMCHDSVTKHCAYYIHQPGSTRGLCQARLHSNCQLLHINRSPLENGKVLCMVCRRPIGSINTATRLVLNQEHSVWRDALEVMHLIEEESRDTLTRRHARVDDIARVVQDDFPVIEFIYENRSLVILVGLVMFIMSDTFDSYMYYTFMTYTIPGGTRKKSRILKGGFKTGKMKTQKEIQEFANIIKQLQKEKHPFHIMLEGNKMDVHKLLKMNHINTKIIK